MREESLSLTQETSESLRIFRRTSSFVARGGVITDLDGTALHERDGRVSVAEPVAQGLKALAELGRPVVINTLRFPLNVIRTFGREWGAITDQPVPLVSLNGGILGLLTPIGADDTTFEEIVAFPLSKAEIDEVLQKLQKLLDEGITKVVLFIYFRDWLRGEIIWSMQSDQVEMLRTKYLSASEVHSGPLATLNDMLLSEEVCMLAAQVEIPEDRHMAYQHSNPNRFVTAVGIDKLSGAREAAARLNFDLDQSVGAGDTPMDSFLAGVALALHVGPLPLSFEGRQGTLKLKNPFELGAALFQLAQDDARESIA